MLWFVFAFVYVLSCRTFLAVGQSTVSQCAASVTGSEERLLKRFEEHDRRMQTMNKKTSSAFEKLETAVNRTIVRDQEERFQHLKTIYYNISDNLQRIGEKIQDACECRREENQEEYLNSLNSSLTSMMIKAEGRIQAGNEILTRNLEELDQNLKFIYHNISSRFDSQETSRSDLTDQGKEHEQKLEMLHKNLSSTFQSEIKNVAENFELMEENESLRIGLINDSFFGAWKEQSQILQTMNDTLSSEIKQINEKLNSILDQVSESLHFMRLQDNCRNNPVVCDCSGIKASGYTTSGVYRIYVDHQGKRHYANAYCDMTTANDSWTVFQRRKDGSEDFYRGWSDYSDGFGDPNGEYWLGNNFLHLLTLKTSYRLRIDLADFEGETRFAEYSAFDISSSVDKYRLRIGNHSGNAGDNLGYHNGHQFSTQDSDNDASSQRNCAVERRGAWWYNRCSNTNLNGLYLRGQFTSPNCSVRCYEGIRWDAWHGIWYSLKATEMKISSS